MLNKKHDNIVIIFAKKPKLGKVKTRIAEETSDDFAYKFSEICLRDLMLKINNTHYYDLAVCVDSLDDLKWFQKNFSLMGVVIDLKRLNIANISDPKLVQDKKFEFIFDELLNKYNYKNAILIPMDIPFITQEDLITAFAMLDKNKFVFGPEINGGVYLIGIKSPFDINPFKNIRWSTSQSYEDLVKNCDSTNVFSLKLKNDLNLPQDIINLKDEIKNSCPALFDFLKTNGFYFSLKDKYLNFDDLSICIPVVANIVQRINENGDLEILIQNRFKPSIDPDNLDKIEIPSGLIKKYESAECAATRETLEETGIISEICQEYQIKDDLKMYGNKHIQSFQPFLCAQQVRGDRAYLCLAFISDYKGGGLKENVDESRNPRWISIYELKNILENNPEQFFGLTLVILKQYLSKIINNKNE